MDMFTSRRGLLSHAMLKIVVAVMIFDIAKVHAHTSLDSDLEAHLNRLNKPAVKTIQTKDGDIIDCVDINKQPAFDHPLLKNHTIQMHPSFVPKMKKNTTTARPVLRQKWRKGGGCPNGTVPIRRVEMSDLLRAAASLESFGRRDTNSIDQDQAGAIQKRWGPWYGASASINAWAISVVQPYEWSHSAVEISDGRNNYIEAGILVNPTIFGDGKTRLYTYWTKDGYHQSGCYNILCSGFVQVSRRFALGIPVSPLSTIDGEQYVQPTIVYKDRKTQNWWVTFLDEPVGYWPKQIFAGDFDEVWQVKWVGSVLNTWFAKEHTATQMGSGRFGREGFRRAAFFENVQLLETTYKYVPAVAAAFFATTPSCYDCVQGNNTIAFFFGGPGGARCQPP